MLRKIVVSVFSLLYSFVLLLVYPFFSRFTLTPINHKRVFFFLQNTSCIRKAAGHLGKGGVGGVGRVRNPCTLSPRYAPAKTHLFSLLRPLWTDVMDSSFFSYTHSKTEFLTLPYTP